MSGSIQGTVEHADANPFIHATGEATWVRGSGEGGQAGSVAFRTGKALAGSGPVHMRSGDATGATGDISLTAGDGAAEGGALKLKSGGGSVAGALTISSPDASTAPGDVDAMAARSLAAASAKATMRRAHTP